MRTFTYARLRVGDTFQWTETGEVYIRCRGGFRAGRGGPLYSLGLASPFLPVILYRIGS